jgi:guanylate kinase
MTSRHGIPFVVSAPSGTGKTTVCRAVVDQDDGIVFSVSHTTRPARRGEVDGVHYHFVDRDTFERLAGEGAFVEHAEYAGNAYGTSFAAIDAPLEAGQDLLLEVDVQGALQLRERRRDARFVFLLPPSMEELERRLRGRGTDSEEAMARRLDSVLGELAAVRHFDYAVVNRDVEQAIAEVLDIVAAERSGQLEAVRERHGRERVVARLGATLPIPP